MTSKRFSRCVLVFGLFALLLSGLTEFGTHTRAQKKEKPVPPAGAYVPGRVLVKFRADTSVERGNQLLAEHGARAERTLPHLGVQVVALPESADESALAQSFRVRPEVEFVELDYVLAAQQMIPNDRFYSDTNAWSLRKIDGPGAWAISTGSSNVVIAILDTGVDGTHEDLAAKMVPGWNIYDNNADTSDVKGHGTMVAGTAAASSNNWLGVTSVAWGCLIMPVRVADSGGFASVSDIANGLTWAADHGARVANISFNATGYATISSAAKYFQNKGGVVTVAAGNDGTAVNTADDPYLLTVGATDPSDVLYWWSNSGNYVDVVAPGQFVTTAPGGIYAVAGGTSFAAPIVAGAAALVLSANPALTPGQVQNIIKQSADDLGTPGWDPTYGYGRINLSKAVNSSAGGSGDTMAPTVVITSPANGSRIGGGVSVSVSAADNVGVARVELYVDGALCGNSAASPFTVKWNSRKAAKGAHALVTKAYDAAGNVGASPAVTVYK